MGIQIQFEDQFNLLNKKTKKKLFPSTKLTYPLEANINYDKYDNYNLIINKIIGE